MTRASTGFNHRRLRSNLLRNAAALDALAELGIDRAFIEERGLGMKEPYRRTDGSVVDGVVAFPIEAEDGRRRYGYVALRGVTRNPEHPVAWSPGRARSVREGSEGVLLVVGSPAEAFRAGLSARRRAMAVAAVASSRPEQVPPEWEDASFWAPWERVVLSDEVPAHLRAAVSAVARRPLHHAPGVVNTGFAELSPAERADAWVDELLGTATPLSEATLRAVEPDAQTPGDYAATPVALHGGFSRGHLYYPFMVERRRALAVGGAGRLVHSYETLILRSDGSVLEAVTLPAPAGTPASQRVHALTDGTRIASPPQPSANSTWSLGAIQAFVGARATGADPCPRAPGAVLSDVRDLIASRVALPSAGDAWVATAFVALTHMFRVFEALPILLVEGPRGSGKTELAAAIASLSFNAAIMGQGSAAALVRLSRECGGLVALDDAEGLSSLGTGFGELSQCLKTGYRAASARKPVTTASGRVETFDFFGPRLVTCTRGVDPVLGSRCIRVPTAPGRPEADAPAIDADDLRDELHALAMVRAGEVADAYAGLAASGVDRADEIWAPMLAIADVLAPEEARVALRAVRSGHPNS